MQNYYVEVPFTELRAGIDGREHLVTNARMTNTADGTRFVFAGTPRMLRFGAQSFRAGRLAYVWLASLGDRVPVAEPLPEGIYRKSDESGVY